MKLIKIDSLKVNFLVREHLSEDRVQALALIVESGNHLDPIEITNQGVVIDGRHRIEAYRLCDQAEIPFIYTKAKTKVDQLARALQCNSGGALPPTITDMRITVEQMLVEGASETKIKALLPFLPASVVRKIITNATSNLLKKRVRNAIDAMLKCDLTIKQAAAEFHVTPEAIRTAMQGKKLKDEPRNFVTSAKLGLTSSFKGVGSKFGQMAKQILTDVADRELSVEDAMAVFNHMTHLLDRQRRLCAAHITRLTTQASNNGTQVSAISTSSGSKSTTQSTRSAGASQRRV